MFEETTSPFPKILTTEEPIQIVIQNPTVCFCCNYTGIEKEFTHCPLCHFPQNQSEFSQIAFIEEGRNKVKQHGKHEETIGWAQTLLLYTGLAGMVIAIGSAIMFGGYKPELFFKSMLGNFALTIALSFPNILLWFWSKRKPFEAILVALSLTLVGGICDYFIQGFRLTAVGWQLLFIIVFANAIMSYKEAVKIEEELIF
jgi:hypothetical protein